MSSGLLPRNPGPATSGSGNSYFASLTVGALTVSGIGVLADLLVSGTTTLAALVVNTTATITGVLSAAAGLLADTVGNYTVGGTLTLQTRSANANVLLSPNGTGAVVVKAGNTLRADNITPTTSGAITIASTSNGAINLSPNGTGAVAVAAGQTLKTDVITATTTNGDISLSANGSGFISIGSDALPAAATNLGSVAFPFGTVYCNGLDIIGSVLTVNAGPDTRTITIPSPASNDTMAVLGSAQTFSAIQTFSVAPVLSAASNQFSIRAGGAGNSLIFNATNPAGASRTLTFPDPGGSDSFVYLALAQTLLNKIIGAGGLQFVNAAGGYVQSALSAYSETSFSTAWSGPWASGSNPTVALTLTRVGRVVFVSNPTIEVTGNSTSVVIASVSTLPAAFTPSTTRIGVGPAIDNPSGGGATTGGWQVSSGGVVTIGANILVAAFSATASTVGARQGNWWYEL